MVTGWFLVMYFGQKENIPYKNLKWAFIWSAVCAIAGARILYIITNANEFKDNFVNLVNPQKGGLVAYGGFLGGFAGAFIYHRLTRTSFLAFADTAVPALASGLGITRIGCFLYGCDYGNPISSTAPLWIKKTAVQFPKWHDSATLAGHGPPAYLHHLHDKLIAADAALSLPVYPSQLIAVANGWIAFILLLWLKTKPGFKGKIFLTFTIYYGITRTLMEILRGDTGRGELWGFSTSQIIGITTLLSATVAYKILQSKSSLDN
jgi:phosphatidylglycerol:prolipoprotein diacylglycerol transferase